MYKTHGFRSFPYSIRPDVRRRLWLALARRTHRPGGCQFRQRSTADLEQRHG